jgi:hypothetical protein
MELDLTLKHFERHFGTFSHIVDSVVTECIFTKHFIIPEHCYSNFINVMKFPFVSPRLIIQTEYNFLNFRGNPKEHLTLSSGRGNNHLYTAEICGADRIRDCVKLVNDLTYWYVQELPNKKISLHYCTKSEKNGIPETLYRWFAVTKITSTFE